jgi:hypothetical protein
MRKKSLFQPDGKITQNINRFKKSQLYSGDNNPNSKIQVQPGRENFQFYPDEKNINSTRKMLNSTST